MKYGNQKMGAIKGSPQKSFGSTIKGFAQDAVRGLSTLNNPVKGMGSKFGRGAARALRNKIK